MSTALYPKLSFVLALVLSVPLALLILFYWLGQDVAEDIALRTPGRDGRPAVSESAERAVDFSGGLTSFSGDPGDLPGAWPGFRGTTRDNIAGGAPRLADAWDGVGPDVIWTVPLGEGYAGPAVLNGRVYVLDYLEETRSDALRCFSLDDGQELWRYSYEIEVRRNHGMSRTVPAVNDSYVVSIGPRCHVLCLDATTGAFIWGMDLQREFGTEEPLWYTGQCPLLDGDRVILAPAGPDALLMAVNLADGEIVWKTPNPMGWQMSHSSVMPMTLAGKRMYVYAALGGVAGVSAEPEDAGALLWHTPWEARVIAPSPVALGDDRILVLAGYGMGGIVIEVRGAAGGYEGVEVSRHGTREGIAAEQHTPVFYDGHLYSIMTKDAGPLRDQFVCYRPDGALVWSSGQEHRFGLGPWLLADGKFYTLDDDGMLYLVRATPDGFDLMDTAQVLHAHESWGPMALAQDRLLVRDMKEMACLYVGAP